MDPFRHLVTLLDVSSRLQLRDLLENATPELSAGLEHLKSCLTEPPPCNLPSPVATPTRPGARSFEDALSRQLSSSPSFSFFVSSPNLFLSAPPATSPPVTSPPATSTDIRRNPFTKAPPPPIKFDSDNDMDIMTMASAGLSARDEEGEEEHASDASSDWGMADWGVDEILRRRERQRRHNQAEAARFRQEAFERLQEDRRQREREAAGDEHEEEDSSDSDYQEDGPGGVRVARRRKRCPTRFVVVMPSALQAARIAGDEDMVMDLTLGERMEGSNDAPPNNDPDIITNNPLHASLTNGYQQYSLPFFKKLRPAISSCLVRIAGISLAILEEVELGEWWKQVLVGLDWSMGAQVACDYSLKGFMDRIRQAETAEAAATFTRILTLMALSAKVGSSTLSKNTQAFWKAEGSPGTLNDFQRWLRYGKTWVMWARGGGVFFILLAVFVKEVSALEQAVHDDIEAVTYFFRSPQYGCTISNLVLVIYLPAINRLRQLLRISIGQLYIAHTHGLSHDSLLNDWGVSDRFFDLIPTHTFLPGTRNTALWNRDLSEGQHVLDTALGSIITRSLVGYELFNNTIGYSNGSPEYSFDALPRPVLDATSVDKDWEDVLHAISKVSGSMHIKVATAFNASHERNKFKLRGAGSKQIQDFTKGIRALAAFAYEPDSLEDFRKKLRRQLKNGYRTSADEYILLDRQKLVDDSRFIHLQDADELPFLIQLPPLPPHLRQNLMLILKTSFPNLLRPALTEEESINREGMALHCSWYNRCATRGHDAPIEGDIHLMGKAHTKRTDASQGIPRVAAEGNKDERWETLQKALTLVTDWLTERMRALFPNDSCTILDVQCHILPGSAAPPVFPFTGVVVNLNVSTTAHRDHKDHRLCLLLVIQDGIGGDLVLVEPGIVVRLETGSSVLFRSCDLTHLNLPYVGLRASIVFHSDQDLKAWAQDYNGWEYKSYFSC